MAEVEKIPNDSEVAKARQRVLDAERLAEQNSSISDRVELAQSLAALGQLLTARKEFYEGREVYERSLSIYNDLSEADHWNVEWSRRIHSIYVAHAELEAAESEFESLPPGERVPGVQAEESRVRLFVSSSFGGRSIEQTLFLIEIGRFEEAQEAFDSELRVLDAMFVADEDRHETELLRVSLYFGKAAQKFADERKFRPACIARRFQIETLKRKIKIKPLLGQNLLVDALQGLGDSELALNEFDRALHAYEAARAIWTELEKNPSDLLFRRIGPPASEELTRKIAAIMGRAVESNSTIDLTNEPSLELRGPVGREDEISRDTRLKPLAPIKSELTAPLLRSRDERIKHFSGRTQWKDALKADPSLTPLRHIEQTYPDRRRGLLRPDLWKVDAPLAQALRNWLSYKRTDGSKPNKMPPAFGLMTAAEWYERLDREEGAPTGADVMQAYRRGDPNADELSRRFAAAERRKTKAVRPRSKSVKRVKRYHT